MEGGFLLVSLSSWTWSQRSKLLRTGGRPLAFSVRLGTNLRVEPTLTVWSFSTTLTTTGVPPTRQGTLGRLYYVRGPGKK